MIEHQPIILRPYPRGFHLITREVMNQIDKLPDNGIFHLFIRHTSASLTINENADPTVRHDFEAHFNEFVPENAYYYQHTLEGSDDMPAHLKASTLGASISCPVIEGKLGLGTWQGIYLGEHRNNGGARSLIATIYS